MSVKAVLHTIYMPRYLILSADSNGALSKVNVKCQTSFPIDMHAKILNSHQYMVSS